jgi:MoxR-like ATPase/predicted DNA-binding WGR domain protein
VTTTTSETAIGWELECTSGTSNKYYRIAVVDTFTVFSYGRIGAAAQYAVQRYPSANDALDSALIQTREKAKKQYFLRATPTKVALSSGDLAVLANRSTQSDGARRVNTLLEDGWNEQGCRLPSVIPADDGEIRRQAADLLAGPASAPAPRRSGVKLKPVGETKRPGGQVYKPRTIAGHEDVALLRAARTRREHTLLSGPPGTGKTALIEAAYPEAEFLVCTADTAEADLVGTWVQDPETGRFVWAPGPLQRSLMNDVPLYVDEIALADPRVLSCLYAPLDGRPAVQITANPLLAPVSVPAHWCLAASYNPDVPGAHLSAALRDRFHHHVEVSSDFQLARELGVPDQAVSAAEHLDAQRRRGELASSPQLRALLAFRDNEAAYGTKYALGSLISAAPHEDRGVTAAAFARAFGVAAKPLTMAGRHA